MISWARTPSSSAGFNERGVVKNLPAIGCHGPNRARNELETDAQAAKERLTQEKLYAGLG